MTPQPVHPALAAGAGLEGVDVSAEVCSPVSSEIADRKFVSSPVRHAYRIVGDIGQVEVIARGPGLRELDRLNVTYGTGRWRKLKGVAFVRIPTGATVFAEVHWYEAHGIGMKELKIKRLIG